MLTKVQIVSSRKTARSDFGGGWSAVGGVWGRKGFREEVTSEDDKDVETPKLGVNSSKRG